MGASRWSSRIPRRAGLLALSLCAVVLGCAADQSSRADEGRIQELELENAELQRQIEILKNRLAVLAPHFRWDGDRAPPYAISSPAFPRIDAKVLVVDHEPELVVLDKGEKDGVVIGYEFALYRGPEFKGMVRILAVQDTRCTGRILVEKNPIAKGDSASTWL